MTEKIKIKKSDLLKLSQFELATIANKLQQYEEAKKGRSLDSYLETAHAGQIAFHKADKRIRLFVGSNRSGKTTAGVIEMLWCMLGRHPFRQTRLPAKGAIIVQDFENHAKNIIEPKFLQWAPPGSIIKTERNQNGAWRKIYFSTGSTIDIYSHDQDPKVFEGTDLDFAWHDEPPPQHLFNAIWRGLTDRGGSAYITGTPITGPWMYREFQMAEKGDPLRWAICVNIEQNATNLGEGDKDLGLKRIADFASMLGEDEKASRLEGKFLQMQGLIFKNWKPAHHKITPFKWPHGWKIIESIDPHPSKPWAVSWTGVTENDKKILLRSGLYSGVIEEIADQILYERTQIEIQGGHKTRVTRTLIDNSASVPIWSKSHSDPTARRKSVREELEAYIGPLAGGVRIEVAPKNVTNKIALFKQWLHVDDKEGTSDFYAFDSAENERFFFEIENYVWDSKRGGLKNGLKDQPRKVDDDILDSIMQVALTLPNQFAGSPEKLRARVGNSWMV